MESPTKRSTAVSHLFLSYSRDDADFVRRLRGAIEARGWSTWVDFESIPSASEWMAEIRRGIESADGFVFVMTPSSLASRMCRVELSIAVDLSKRLLPLRALADSEWKAAEKELRERISMEMIEDVPLELQKLDYVDMNDFKNYENQLELLVDELLKAASNDLPWLIQHTRLQGDVKRWIDSRYASAALLRGPLLFEAKEMLSAVDKDPPLTDTQREYIEASLQEHERTLLREVKQLTHRLLDLPDERIAIGIMVTLKGREVYLPGLQLEGVLRTFLSRWSQRNLIRHEHHATTGTFSRDGTKVLTSSYDGRLRWIDTRAGNIAKIFQYDVPILKAVLSSNGKFAAAACADGHVQVIELETARLRNFRVSDDGVNDVTFDATGQTIACVSGVLLFVIDLESGRIYQLQRHPDAIRSVTFHGDKFVATTCKDGRVRFFHLDARRWEEFGLPDLAINNICLSPDGTWMVLGGSFSGALLVDIATRTFKNKLEVTSGSAVLTAMSGNGKCVAVADLWGRVLVFDTQTGEQLAKKQLFPRYAWSIAINHDGSLFCGASDTGPVIVCETSSERQWLCAGHDGPVRMVEFQPTGDLLVTTGSDFTVRLFVIGHVPGTLTLPHTHTVINADVSGDGSHIVTSARDGIIRTFDSQSGAVLSHYAPVYGTPLSATFTSVGDLVVAFEDGHIALVNAGSGNEIRLFKSVPIESASEVRMTHNQRWIVVRRFQEIVRVLNAEDGAILEVDEQDHQLITTDILGQVGLIRPSGRIRDGEPGAAPFLEREGAKIYLKAGEFQVVNASLAPDGSVVVGAALNRRELPIFASTDGELIAQLRLDHPSNSARFCMNGSCIVATWLNTVSLISYPNRERLLELTNDQVYRELSDEERAEFGFRTELPDDEIMTENI